MNSPGLVVLMGSGETSASGGKVFESIARRLASPLKIAVLETPAGFELNAARVAGRVADFLKTRLQNYKPVVVQVPARRRFSPFSPDDPEMLEDLYDSQLIFLGPGSPTYTVRQLSGSLAWDIVTARHRQGAALVLASAAVIALGVFALPVYEIFKAGEDLHWKTGLDFFAAYGLSLVFVPHWNNTQGGLDLDTSRCFMGQSRFDLLEAGIPSAVTVVGLDEHTSITIDLANADCLVSGKGGVHLLKNGGEQTFLSATSFPLDLLGPFSLPRDLRVGIPGSVWKQAGLVQDQIGSGQGIIPATVLALAEDRLQARSCQDWEQADLLRDQILSLGWKVLDTPAGQKLEPLLKA